MKKLVNFNFANLFLIIGLISLPLAGLLLHLRLHPDVTYLTPILLFDIVIITLLLVFRKTMFYGFILNTVLFLTGVIGHLTVAGGLTDVLLGVPDFTMGYVFWRLNNSENLNSESKVRKNKK